MAIDYTDPVAVLGLLRPAYYALLAGQATQTVDWPGPNGTSRRITYAQTDLSKLNEEILRLEGKLPNTTGKPARFAIRCG